MRTFFLFIIFIHVAFISNVRAEDKIVESLFGHKEMTVDEDTPVSHVEIMGGKSITGHRSWRAPDYTGQKDVLGYQTNPFATPKGMEKQVQFWIDIYAKFSTWQGVIHDSENIDLIYEVVDFSEINQTQGLTLKIKEKLKKKMVEDAKLRASLLLEKLDGLQSPDTLNEQERKIWNYFSNINDPDKYREAKDKNRIRFQLGQKDRMQAAIFFSGRYIEDFEKIFAENKLPVELTRLIFVESSFNVLARSKVGASGLWQIMPYTARPHRMLTASVDGRNHPVTATKLAARLLNDNYKMLQSWPLAVTGYNHGPTGVKRMADKYGTRDLAELIQNVRSRKSFGFASRNFYASFLAALEVERNANKYFENVTWSKKLNIDEIRLPRPIKYQELQSWFDGDDEKTQIFNPHLTQQARRWGRGIPVGTLISVPAEKYSKVLLALGKTAVRSPANAYSGKTETRFHKVVVGESLTVIAREYGVKVRDILAENNIESASLIMPGQKLKIP